MKRRGSVGEEGWLSWGGGVVQVERRCDSGWEEAWLSRLVRGFRSKRSPARFSVTSTSVSTFL